MLPNVEVVFEETALAIATHERRRIRDHAHPAARMRSELQGLVGGVKDLVDRYFAARVRHRERVAEVHGLHLGRQRLPPRAREPKVDGLRVAVHELDAPVGFATEGLEVREGLVATRGGREHVHATHAVVPKGLTHHRARLLRRKAGDEQGVGHGTWLAGC